MITITLGYRIRDFLVAFVVTLAMLVLIDIAHTQRKQLELQTSYDSAVLQLMAENEEVEINPPTAQEKL